MAKKKKPSPSFRRKVVSLVILFFLLVAIGATTAAIQQRQDLLSLAAGIVPGGIGCRKVPAGNYNVKVETYALTKWEVICPHGRWSGEIPATTIPFGYRWVPTIRKGDTYTLKTALKDVCTSPRVEAGWNNVCQVCEYIDCSKIKISGKLAVRRIDCLLGAYRAEGQGNVNVTYQGSGLGSCTAKANYSGRLGGSFVVGIKD